MTNTTHRPRCTRPGWTTEPSRSITGITIARCTGCDATELRAAASAPMEGSAAGGSHGRPPVGDESSGRWSA